MIKHMILFLVVVLLRLPFVTSHEQWFNLALMDSLQSSFFMRKLWHSLCASENGSIRCRPSSLDQRQISREDEPTFRPAREEGIESKRQMPKSHDPQLLKSVQILRIVSEYNTSSRYFGLISNLRGEDSSVPRGLYFQARESRIGNHDKSGTSLIQTLFYVPEAALYLPQNFGDLSTVPSLISMGSFVEDWRPAHNLNVITFEYNNTRHIVGVGGVNIRGNILSEIDAYQTTSLANLLAGVWRYIPRVESKQNITSSTDNRKVTFDGNLHGCFDRRAKHRLGEVCQFDGKHSIVRHANAFSKNTSPHFYVYSRTNLATRGGRFVQVARSTNDDVSGNWDGFKVITVQGFNTNITRTLGRAYKGNIYYPSVKHNPLDNRTLIGLFPVMELLPDGHHTAGYIGAALSCDGLNFSPMIKLVKVPRTSYGRTYDMPVDGFAQDSSGRMYLFVQRNVPGVIKEKYFEPTCIAQYEIDRKQLLDWTMTAMASLPSCQYSESSVDPWKVPDEELCTRSQCKDEIV